MNSPIASFDKESLKYFHSLIVFLVVHLTKCSQLSPSSFPKQPQIWLVGYEEVDSYSRTLTTAKFRSEDCFWDDMIRKNGSDYYISDQVRVIVFACTANYPIDWKFPFREQLRQITNRNMESIYRRISDVTMNSTEPVNIQFKSVLFIFSSDLKFLSINLTCGSTNNRIGHKSSVNIYLQGKQSLEYEGKTLQVFAKATKNHNNGLKKSSEESSLVLPCRSLPMFGTPTLEFSKAGTHTQNFGIPTANEQWIQLNLTQEYLSYDPNIGFTINRSMTSDSIFGLYRCSVSRIIGDITANGKKTNNQFTYFNVTTSPESNKFKALDVTSRLSLKARSSSHGNASLGVPLGGSVVICCSGIRNKPPNLYVKYCRSHFNCQLGRKTIIDELPTGDYWHIHHTSFNLLNDSRGCYKEELFDIAATVVCLGEIADFADTYVNMFHPQANSPVENRSRKLQTLHPVYKMEANISSSLTTFNSLAAAEISNSYQRILLILGKRSVRKPSNHHEIIFDSNGMYDFYDLEGPVIHRGFYLIIKEYDRDTIYSGDSLEFMCFGTPFFYARGPHLILNWKNGTRTNLSLVPRKRRISFGLKTRLIYLSGSTMLIQHGESELISVFGEPIRANQEMSSVDCWMPQVNTSNWDRINKRLHIVASVSPKFAEKENEVVYFNFSEYLNVLTCTVVNGLPFPSVRVTMNGVYQRIIIRNTTEQQENNVWLNDRVVIEGFNNDSRLATVKIVLSNSTKGPIIFQCIAENVNGTVKRTIKLVTIQKLSNILQFAVGMAVIVTCILIIAASYWYWFGMGMLISFRANRVV